MQLQICSLVHSEKHVWIIICKKKKNTKIYKQIQQNKHISQYYSQSIATGQKVTNFF